MNSTSSSPRRLTRSTTDKKLGGVAAGLADYFNLDPLLVRVGFVVTTLLSGAGLIAYLALLAFAPRDSDAPASASGSHAVATA
ncbi:MAG TPA: PspC domain-containing protein [Baekduia sp.]|uniref:PspC domain-containing protein n=1 Tax=Baekduia sp. TaxID=2600305 RepID=UPI002BFFF9C7|nr:PspC domain-containing protein [Baekduia sp.]HMJ36163.1 PspC domain-containing protein [Baekduia sp.]